MKKLSSQRESSRRSLKKFRNNFFVEDSTFKISKINLNNIINQKKYTSKVKINLHSETNRNLEKNQTKITQSQYIQRTQSLNYRIRQQPTHSVQLVTSPIKQYQNDLENPFIRTNINKQLENFDKELKQFNIEQSKISRRQYGLIKSYAVNTHGMIMTNHNQDRLSIVTNLLNCDIKSKNSNLISFFGIYDGHNGSACAQYLRDYLHIYIAKDPCLNSNMALAIQNSLKKIESEFFRQAQKRADCSGSSALIVIIQGRIINYEGRRCYVANIGDSRAILCKNYGKQIIQLSSDHNLSNNIELKRILKSGGNIYQNNKNQNPVKHQLKILPGKLKVSRSIGDYQIKNSKNNKINNIVISDPEIREIQIEQQADFIVMASDGVFERLSNMQVVKSIWSTALFRKRENIHEQSGDIINGVLLKALKNASLDCMSCLIICLDNMAKALFEEDEIKLPGIID